MSRPISDGLLYFPFDVDFFQDHDIRLLKKIYGVDGIAIYLFILCEIYRGEGYYIKVDKYFNELIADGIGMSTEKISLVISFLLERSLLIEISVDRTLFKSDTVYTGKRIQDSYQHGKSGTKGRWIIVDADIWILPSEKTMGHIKVIDKSVIHGNNRVNNGIKAVFQGNNPQSKVKESKEEYKKEYPFFFKYIQGAELTLEEEEVCLIYTAYFKPKKFSEYEDLRKILNGVKDQQAVVSAMDITYRTPDVKSPLKYIKSVAYDIKNNPDRYLPNE